MKKIIAGILCICIAAGVCSCSKSDESSAEKEKEESSSVSENASQDSNIDELLKKIDEQQKLIDEQNKKFDTIAAVCEQTFGEDIFSDSFDINSLNYGEVHPIYDDTAVVAAYKSGDSSAITDEKDKFILETATNAIKEIIKDDMSDFEKEKAVYDYVFSQSRYDDGNLSAIPHTQEYSHTPYGVLHDHTAICVGNATTFKLFMDMLDIECKIIHSTEEGEHAWDLVKIEDDWYHVDITFDNGNQKPAYTMFNVTDAVKDNGGYPWDHDEFPAANGTKYNFAVMNAKEIKDIYATADLFAKAIENKDEFSYFKFKLSDKNKKFDEIAVFYNSIIMDMSYQIGGGYCDCSAAEGVVIDDYYYGGISINFYDDDEPGYDPSEPSYDDLDFDLDKFNQVYSEAFGVTLDYGDYS